MQIKIIRHSERLDYANPLKWLFYFGQYWYDAPLTINGSKSAKEKGKNLKDDIFNPKYIFTSPYTRTLTTSTEIKETFSSSKIIIEPLLAEYQPKDKHTIALYPDGIPTTYNDINTEFSFPETYEDFTKRIKFIIQQLIDDYDQDMIIITHGESLKVFINYLQNMYPESILNIDRNSNIDKIPYLTTISFIYDKTRREILHDSIKID
uniref:Phosphoglycerate mutase family protein n=1 Tax=viral metagenome TaxID=1070528 RepID=A0A6C0LQY9_9ZZZZ